LKNVLFSWSEIKKPSKIDSNGASNKTLSHFCQNAACGKFLKYDYGKSQNMLRYGQESPPEIQLNDFGNVKTMIFYGTRDNLCTFGLTLPNLKETIMIDNFDHVSFILGRDTEWIDKIINEISIQ
jgi:hypothetical protein